MTSNTAVRPPPSETSGSDFARLSRKIADAGLMGRRPGYYALRITMVAGLYVGGWAAVALIGDSWWTLAVAGFLAVVFGQVALLAHDAAHRQVFRRRRASEVSGRIAGAGIGMGYGTSTPATTPTPTMRNSTPTSTPTCWSGPRIRPGPPRDSPA
jgi:fatty acid desaturase